MASDDEDDLEALRNAALASLWKKQAEQAPQGIQVVSVLPQQVQAQPEEISYTTEYDDVPEEVERLFLSQRGRGRRQGQRGRGRGRGVYNANPNVIIIPTVPMEGEEKPKDKKKTFFLRPQDKWAMPECNSGSSSPKTKDTSKFSRYDDDSESDEDFEETNKMKHDSDPDHKQNDELDDSVKSVDLNQSRSEVETMDHSLYETVSEVESDMYYDSGVQSDKAREVLNQSGETDTENQVGGNILQDVQLNKSESEVVEKDSSFGSEQSENYNRQSENEVYLDNTTADKVGEETSETITKLETEIDSCNEDKRVIAPKTEAQIPVASIETSESASNLSSTKFSRFNRRRRRSSGSDSDASGLSDVSSWSASQSRSNFERLNSELDRNALKNSESDVSSTPLSKGSAQEDKDLSNISSDTDSDSSESSSSDQSSSSSSSTVRQYEMESLGTKSVPFTKELVDSKESRKSPHKQKTYLLTEINSQDRTIDKDSFTQRQFPTKMENSLSISQKINEKKRSQNGSKCDSGQKNETESDAGSVRAHHSLHGDESGKAKSRQNKDINEDMNNRFHSVKSKYKSGDEDVRHFKEVSIKSEKEKTNKKKGEMNKDIVIDKKGGNNFKGRDIEQIVLDARSQKYESSEITLKEIRTVSVKENVPKLKAQSKKYDSQTKTANDSWKSNDDKKDEYLKDKDMSLGAKSENTSRGKRSKSNTPPKAYQPARSKTPPKAYLKAMNKKIVKGKEKRPGSVTPPKAYSKDLHKVEKRRKSSHSGDRKRRSSGSSKKNKSAISRIKKSESDSGNSVSSLSDMDTDSEPENWRDKKTGATRKRDDIERERKIRQAAEREKQREERRDYVSNERQNKDRDRNTHRFSQSKTDIDSFDARDYRPQVSVEHRHRSRRDFIERRPDERVFYRRNKTFIEEEPSFHKKGFFEEELSDDSRHNEKKGIISVVKSGRKRSVSEVELEDVKVSGRPAEVKKEGLSKKVKKETLIISVQDSSEDEKVSKRAKSRKLDSKRKKTKHKRSRQESSGESENERKKQHVDVTINKGQGEKPRKSVYDRLGVPVTKTKGSYDEESSRSRKDTDRAVQESGKDVRSRDKRSKQRHNEKQSSAIRKVYHEDNSDQGKDALNAKIKKIHEKNAEIIQRRKEIEQDRQKYG